MNSKVTKKKGLRSWELKRFFQKGLNRHTSHEMWLLASFGAKNRQKSSKIEKRSHEIWLLAPNEHRSLVVKNRPKTSPGATKYGSARNVARLKGVRSSYSIEPRNLFTTP